MLQRRSNYMYNKVKCRSSY